MEFHLYEETIDEESQSAMERLHGLMFTTFREAMLALPQNVRYRGIDLWLANRWYDDVHDHSRVNWHHIDGPVKPPKDGTYVWLRGIRHTDQVWDKPRPVPTTVVVGRYREGNIVQGWEDERGAWFAPQNWADLHIPQPTST